MSKKAGYLAEQKASAFLQERGLKWLESNYRCRWGEIDLIMRDKGFLVFIEVRYRAHALFGGAISSVTFNKQQKLIKTAWHYLTVNKLFEKQPVRFDVLSLEGTEPHIEWIKNAFGLDF